MTAFLTPLRDNVLLKQEAAETETAFGLMLPDVAQRKPKTAVVLAVGPGVKHWSGAWIPVSVKPGDRVMFKPQKCFKIRYDGEEYLTIGDPDIVGVYEP